MIDNKKRPGKELDRIDRNILNELQKDGRISNVELSKRVGLSPTPCLERVRRLERQGFIHGYTALLNPQYLDASLLVIVEITLNRGAPDVFEQFNAAVKNLEEIQECHLVSGDFDYLLKTECLICLPTGHYLVKPCFACRGLMTLALMSLWKK